MPKTSTLNSDKKTLPLDQDLETMLLSAERYAVGRRTYIVDTTVDYILPLLPVLSDWCIAILHNDLKGVLEMEIRSGNQKVWGDLCDRTSWLKLLDAVKAEQKRREKNEQPA